ncbi:electron carrier heme binding iron ion binding monooxygenase oxygen binding [Musa troglodytarum]|uniref:Electron carrier heme binding iron ion binding monooxygenase oxygen binding n=1 Tax=Musa troglodytarum TaxID=320322 RepID=A0A9E7GV31_9LILI|nr:electron carrier heme binding iron ion binding monooxygenase oxygen binding [Musa troglodytarum]
MVEAELHITATWLRLGALLVLSSSSLFLCSSSPVDCPSEHEDLGSRAAPFVSPSSVTSSPPRSRLLLVISSPATVEECLATHNLSFLNRPLLFSGKHLHYDGTSFVVAPYGPSWRNLRSIATLQLLSSASLSRLAHIRAANVRSLLRGLFLHSCSEECGFVPVSMRPSFTELMLNTLLEMIVGKKCYGGSAATEGLDEEGKGFASVIKEAFRLSSAASPEDFLPFLKWIGVNGLEKQLIRLGKEIDVLLQGMVDERREGTRTERNDAKKTLVDDMLSLQEEDPQYYTDNIIKGMISLNSHICWI